MRMRNRSGHQVTVRGLGLVVPPGGTCEIADGYCQPQLATNGSRQASIIESVAPQLVPDDPAEEAEWRKAPKNAPAAPTPSPEEVAKKLESEGLPPAVAAIAAAGPPEPKQRRGRKAEA